MLRRALLAAAVVALLAGGAAAHVPAFAADNTTPATAHEVDPPTKSWAVYDSLAAGQVRYYELRLAAGDRLELSLFTPEAGAFTPSMVVMSPTIDRNDSVPSAVTVPEGYGTLAVEGERPAEPSYEPFTPAANYQTASYGRTVDEGGRYLVAVYEPTGRAGQVGVVAGDRESFTAEQYPTVAVDLPRIYLWEGDHPVTVFGPTLAVVVAGVGAVRRRVGQLDGSAVRGLLALSGLLLAGSAATMTVQMLLALSVTGSTGGAVVTSVFVAVPALLGALVVRLATNPSFTVAGTGRVLLAIAGLGGLATWAGYLVAPLAVLSVALWPKNPLEAD